MSQEKGPDTQQLPKAKEAQFQRAVVRLLQLLHPKAMYDKQEWSKGLKVIEPLYKEFPQNGSRLPAIDSIDRGHFSKSDPQV